MFMPSLVNIYSSTYYKSTYLFHISFAKHENDYIQIIPLMMDKIFVEASRISNF